MKGKLLKKPEKVIELNPQMLEMIKSFQTFRQGAANSRSLWALKSEGKKRRRVEV